MTRNSTRLTSAIPLSIFPRNKDILPEVKRAHAERLVGEQTALPFVSHLRMLC